MLGDSTSKTRCVLPGDTPTARVKAPPMRGTLKCFRERRAALDADVQQCDDVGTRDGREHHVGTFLAGHLPMAPVALNAAVPEPL